MWLRYALLIALAALSWTRSVDEPAADYLDTALKRTLVTFAVARALNGSISLLQDADLSLSPAGVGVTVSPGELLDPINDLIEQFSSILLLASISLGTQRILLSISGATMVSALLSASLLALMVLQWRRESGVLRRLAFRAATLLLLLRFLVPMYALAIQGIDRYFLQPQYEEASAALDLGRAEAEVATREAPDTNAELGLGQRLESWWRDASETLDVRTRVYRLMEKLSGVSDHIISLCVIFLMQSILLPLSFLSLASYLLRSVWRLSGNKTDLASG